MDASTRLRYAIAEEAYAKVLETGYAGFFDFDDLAGQVGATTVETRRTVRTLVDGLYLTEDQPGYAKATPRLLVEHEEQNRAAAYRQNAVRRYVLQEAAEAGDLGGWIEYRAASEEPFTQNELFMAANVLDYLGLVERDRHNLNSHFSVKITGRGYELLDDELRLAETLPIGPTEDAHARLVVAPDALKDVIIRCEQALETRGWKQALLELRRGDAQYARGDWLDAVREYYSSLESGLKYAPRRGLAATSTSSPGALHWLSVVGQCDRPAPGGFAELVAPTDLTDTR